METGVFGKHEPLDQSTLAIDAEVGGIEEFDFSVFHKNPRGCALATLREAYEKLCRINDPLFAEAIGLNLDELTSLLPLEDEEVEALPSIPFTIGVSDDGILFLDEELQKSEQPEDSILVSYLVDHCNALQTLAAAEEIAPEIDEEPGGSCILHGVNLRILSEKFRENINTKMLSDGQLRIGPALAIARTLGYTFPSEQLANLTDKYFHLPFKDGHSYITPEELACAVALFEARRNGGISKQDIKFVEAFLSRKPLS
ncbi:hypothetical protein A3A55_02560 [Candidatus Roizmanbacteria bacterium RIFCSPLOWO2_01_FULL_40_14]|uniref:Uncharacterized protein n=3 Tax=Candidatus Roizmaniibacteriota TaxID=1752723 RepID=A0A0G0XBJ4_9BACT|nr:MAG: hypothetical protein UT85_C0003G0034 [Candidatus Levybacteria bacterium GW2011_GWA2_40_16]KKR72045.1 MAG: hypothetical protein UU14_C0013G0019 [Candidatus Roizmanbacteria bacterium GW2011_GWB1_40_7]KKR94390.1 MAG: hypothetical protein UU41_C0007G0023 [Candidatus Roizmanbacteria bacterium GW2011_GWA1_41_13]KKS22339.1 MAG: hypothetical protein UU78_C0018G0011 [Candidatus Roizmanbacteria bacterium GW2011_GWC2_41_7]OGK47944.1 MAG: hypothetical protein A3A55_02560 [Candidatus Roizmanbacteria